MLLNKSRNMPVSHYDQDTMISHNVLDSNCHPRAPSRNHPYHRTAARRVQRKWKHHSKEQL